MSNTLTGLIPTIYEGLDTVSRELIGLIPAVNRDSNIERAVKGQMITAFVAPPVTVSDIVPAVTPPNDGDQTFGSYQITIDNAKRVPIRWNGEEQRALNNGGHGVNALLAAQFAEGFRALANMIEADVFNKARVAASRAYGTSGTAPFGVNGDFTDFSNMSQILDENGAGMADRHMVLNAAAVNNLRGKQGLLNRVNEAGTDNLLRRGILDNIHGYDLHQSAGIKPVVKGTGAGFVLGAGTYPEGTTALPVTTGTGTINPGDVITLAGDGNKYVVVEGTNGAGSISIGSPGLKQAHAAADTVTLSASFTPNLAFTRSAIVLGTRAPALPIGPTGQPMDMAEDRIMVVDGPSGLAFEVSTYLQYRQIQYEIALAWGAAVVKEDNIAILQG